MWRARARSHKIGGYSALAALVALHAAFFRGFDVALVKSRLGDGAAIVIEVLAFAFDGSISSLSGFDWRPAGPPRCAPAAAGAAPRPAPPASPLRPP